LIILQKKYKKKTSEKGEKNENLGIEKHEEGDKEMCPFCNHEFNSGTSNREINKHIDNHLEKDR